jgi:DNA helicase-2/ATP-dependent DNA helicase PcrA
MAGDYRAMPDTKYNYAAAQKVSYKTAYSTPKTASTVTLELNKGDMVQHTAFGKGMVLSVIKMGGDALLEIAFDQIGTKKLMAKTASAHMKRL